MPLVATPYTPAPTGPLYAFDADLPAIPHPDSDDRVWDAVWVTTQAGNASTLAGSLAVHMGTFRAGSVDPARHPITTFRDAVDWADSGDGGTCAASLMTDRFGKDWIWTSGPDPDQAARFLTSVRDGLPDPPDGYTGWFRLVGTDAPTGPCTHTMSMKEEP